MISAEFWNRSRYSNSLERDLIVRDFAELVPHRHSPCLDDIENAPPRGPHAKENAHDVPKFRWIRRKVAPRADDEEENVYCKKKVKTKSKANEHSSILTRSEKRRKATMVENRARDYLSKRFLSEERILQRHRLRVYTGNFVKRK